MSVESWLRARQKDGQRIGFLKTGEGTLRDMLKPLLCAILSIPPEYGFALPGMVELLCHFIFTLTLYFLFLITQCQWNLYTDTKLRKHYDEYKYSKDVLHRPKQRSLEDLKKMMSELFLEKPLGRIIHLQTYGKEGWNIFELMELQEVLADSQLLMVEVQPSNQSCHFRFVGPPRPNSLFSLKEGNHFHGIKEPNIFFGKYCDLH